MFANRKRKNLNARRRQLMRGVASAPNLVMMMAASVLLASCAEDGDPGPQGPQGPQGPEGPAGPPAPTPPVPEPTGEVPEMVDGAEIRTIDGVDNNEQFEDIGSTFEQLSRLAPSDYGDLISTLAGALRPSPRLISNEVSDQAGADIPNTFGTSDFLWQWGQFLDHDIDLTPAGGADAAIPVPAGDPSFDPANTGTQTIEFTRSIFDPTTGNVTGKSARANQYHYILD